MPKIRQTNKVMKVGNQWLPAFLNSVNGSPTYTYMNDSGQWADASGNTYNVEHPLDEVTVKYDPKTGGQINKAAPDYWRQYGQRRMQQTAGNVDKVIMGTVGAATAPLWLPQVYGAGLALGGNPAVQQFTNQVLYGLGADAALKATTGYDYSEAGQRLFSKPLQRIGLNKGASDLIGQFTGGALNPGYYMPAMKMLNSQKLLNPAVKQTKHVGDIDSGLDWSPKSWFKTRATGSYDAQDVAALASHVPEYREIERIAKSNGTWLKMPDGSLWQGDPRTWVQMQSKAMKKFEKTPLFHGDSDIYRQGDLDMTPIVMGRRRLWTSTNKYLPQTYGNKQYILTYPKDTPVSSVDAHKRTWRYISSDGLENTNTTANRLSVPENVVRVNNVIDPGPNRFDSKLGFDTPKPLRGEEFFDYIGRVYMGDDLVINEKVPRKSLLGNNGDFDLSNYNIYKSLIPTIIGGAYYTN